MKFDFPNDSGEVLSGKLELPTGTPRAFALFAHCFTCSKDSIAANVLAKALTGQGIGVLRFDFTGLGNSEGDFSNTNFSSNVADLISACEHLENQYRNPDILIGHSLGGTAVLKAATVLKKIKAVVTIGAPSSANHLSQLFENDMQSMKKNGEAEVDLGGRRFTLKKQFLEDIRRSDILAGIKGFRKALLVMHAPLDEMVPIEHASAIFQAAKHPKSFVTLDNADHLLSKNRDGKYAAKVIAAWVDRYIDPSSDRKHIKGTKGKVRVLSRQGAKYTQDIVSVDHHLIADEPLAVKGDNLGMNPYEFLLAGLGACTSMTLRMYADRKGIALDGVEVELTHDKIHAEDCYDCESKRGMIDRIMKVIKISGSLTDGQKSRLYEIAEKCPVNRTLKSEIFIESKHE